MSRTWRNLSPVFCAIADGSLLENVDQFDDEQIRPFLPLLLSQSFCGMTDGSHAKLMGRLSTFGEGNHVLKLLMSDFTVVEQDLLMRTEDKTTLSLCDELTKLKLVLYSFLVQEQKDDKTTSTLVSEDNILETIFLFKVGYLKLAHLFNAEHLTLRMLTLHNGTHILLSLICVAPELLDPVLMVLKALQVSDECAKGRNKASLLGHIFHLQPAAIWPTLEEMSLSRRDCLLAVRLACDHMNDEDVISYLTNHLLHREAETVIRQMISRSSARATLNTIYDRLVRIGKDAIQSGSQEPLTDVIRLMAFLQQHCVAKLNADQQSTFCGILCRPEVGDDSHIVFTTTVLMAIPSFTQVTHQAGTLNAIDERVPAYFRWLKKIVTTRDRPYVSQNLIYIATCVFSTKRDQLTAMFTDLLRTKISIMPRHLEALNTMLSENFLRTEEVALECTMLPVTNDLNANSGMRLPLNSVYTCFMLASATNIGPWLERQLQCCTYPIHPILPELLERYAAHAVHHKHAGLSPEFIKVTFEGELIDESKLAQRVLAFLFLLSYRYNLDNLGPKAKEFHSPEIYSKLPVRYLLSVVTSRYDAFAGLHISLIRLATDICPYMLPTVDSVKVLKTEQGKKASMSEVNPETYMSMLKTPEGLITVTRKLQNAPISDQVKCIQVVIDAFVRSLEVDSPVPVVESVVSLYQRLENVVPRMLYEDSVREWIGRGKVTLKELYEYPSLIFRCDRRILSSPPHFRCFIRALSFFLSAGQNSLLRKIHAANMTSQNDQEKSDREVLANAFDHTQTSMVVQLLVEVSDERRMKDDPSNEAAMHRRSLIRSAACEYIHRLFIADKMLLRLVLFQGFPVHMVSTIVDEVPCMFMANEFMQEMLSLPDMNRRIFAVSLMVHISRKYRIAAHCQSVEMVLDVLHTLMRYSESSMNVRLFTKIVPSIIHIASIFPQLAADVTNLLIRVSAMAKARLALQPLMIRPNCEERRLIELISTSLSQQIDLEAW